MTYPIVGGVIGSLVAVLVFLVMFHMREVWSIDFTNFEEVFGTVFIAVVAGVVAGFAWPALLFVALWALLIVPVYLLFIAKK